MKLKNAAQATAYCGRSTRVDTMVAIEFAASCRPLRKSKMQRDRDQRDQQRQSDRDDALVSSSRCMRTPSQDRGRGLEDGRVRNPT